jgi:hypothetical protein
MHFKFLLLAVLFAVPQLALAKPQCDQKYGIWASEADGVRYVVYGSDGVAYNSDVYFEEWRQSKLAWRAKAKVTCSNGAVTYGGEEGIRTLDTLFRVYSLSRGAPSTTRPPLQSTAIQAGLHHCRRPRLRWCDFSECAGLSTQLLARNAGKEIRHEHRSGPRSEEPVPGRAEQGRVCSGPGGEFTLSCRLYIKQRFKRPRMDVRGKHFMVPVCGGCFGSGTIRPKASGNRRESP